MVGPNYISFFPRPLAERTVPLPSTIVRQYVATPTGDLELLYAEPAPVYDGQRKTPLFFAHGGCGSAAVWVPFMEFFSQQHHIPCYAVSYRGHGASWYPSYLRMYFAGRRTLAADLAAGIKYVQEVESKLNDSQSTDVVLIAHSNAGGLSQTMLDDGIGDIRVKGLGFLAATPSFGSVGVNMNWSWMDPWFSLRLFFKHLGNPMSPLSSAFLVQQAFFCASYPLELVEAFRNHMPAYESFAWPLSIMFRFCDRQKVIKRVSGWGAGYRMLILGATEDKLMTPDLTRRTALEYREAARILATGSGKAQTNEDHSCETERSTKDGVRYDEVDGAGHHLQNDLQWEVSARKVLEFYDQL